MQQGMFAADLGFARNHAREPLLEILDALEVVISPSKGLSANIDVRVHELARGDYPASPGWHCDAPQREVSFADCSEKIDVSDTILVSVSSRNGGVSNTVIAPHEVLVEDDTMTAATWRELDEAYGLSDDFGTRTKDGQLISLTPYTPHRVEAARCDGVRMFVRCSVWKPPENHRPGISKTEQIYRLI